MINELSGLAAAMPRTPIAELQNGQAYLRLKLRDATGEVSCIHFDPSEEALGVTAGDVVVAGGAYSVHPQYGPQIQVRRLRLAEPDSTTPSISCRSRPSAPPS